MREAALEILGARVAHAADGAPILVGRDGHVSISHDGEWTAAVVSDAPVGIDLCLRRYSERTRAIVAWLRIDCDADPCALFAALEAVLKLRRLGIERLLARDFSIARDGDDLVVRGLDGDPVRVQVHHYPDFVMAVCG